MNSVKVEIQNEKGNWCTWNNVAIPVKYGQLLDEQLDYAQISLVRIRKARFAPLTKARITVTSTTTDAVKPQSKILEYFVADDTSEETPVGSGIYNHTLTLIEYTKFLECFPLESLCFTNPSNERRVEPGLVIGNDDNYVGAMTLNYSDYYQTPTKYYTPAIYDNGNINILPNLTDFLKVYPLNDERYSGEGFALFGNSGHYIKFEFEDGDVATFNYTELDGTPPGESLNIQTGTSAKVTVRFDWTFRLSSGSTSGIKQTEFSFYIYIATYKNPLMPYTVNDVIQRVLQLVEPLRKNETPRFSFTPPTDAKAKLFDKFSPEFTFTRNTLREALQQIGGYIHAEPRLNPDMSIGWDFYGEEEKAQYTNYKTGVTKDLSLYKYRTLQRKRNLDETANALDSYQQNLVNRLDWQNATTATPFDGGFQTLRMETAWVRKAEENSYHAETAEAIDRVVKVEMRYGEVSKDITQYVYDKKVYDNLSGISEVYPNAKVTSLYYTQGQKGIYGLFYKNPSEWGNGIGKNYAIVNIYNYAFGKSVTKLDYEKIQFCITYVPIYSTRVQQVKQYVQDFLPLPRTINYTQSENSVEASYFGENIKGAILRMGNAEKNITMNFRNLDNIPKAGLLFDDDYYIAEVSTAVLSDHFEVTLGLSKNFNRKSKYIGASSIKRIYEVSEEQVQERHTVLQDYLVITDKANNFANKTNNENGYFNTTISTLMAMFNGHTDDRSIAAVQAVGYTANGTPQEKVLLPVISSAFGNTIEFTWHYKDNFSAGFQAKYEEGAGDVKGMFTVETEYTDYYGRLYYYFFGLMSQSGVNAITDTEKSVEESNLLPQFIYDGNSNGVSGNLNDLVSIDDIESDQLGNMNLEQSNPIVLRKDSRETLKFTYAINFVTDKQDIIIGTAFASNNSLITLNKERPHLYVLSDRINKFAKYLDATKIVEDLGVQAVSGDGVSFRNPLGKTASVEGQAWVYAYPITTTEKTFENENGESKTITLEEGGEIVFGKNVDISKNDIVGKFWAYYVHDIYKYYDFLKKQNN